MWPGCKDALKIICADVCEKRGWTQPYFQTRVVLLAAYVEREAAEPVSARMQGVSGFVSRLVEIATA